MTLHLSSLISRPGAKLNAPSIYPSVNSSAYRTSIGLQFIWVISSSLNNIHYPLFLITVDTFRNTAVPLSKALMLSTREKVEQCAFDTNIT